MVRYAPKGIVGIGYGPLRRLMCMPKNVAGSLCIPLACTFRARARLTICCGEEESVTCTVKLNAPLSPVVPETAPLDPPSCIPAGMLPDSVVQVYGVIPPETGRNCE